MPLWVHNKRASRNSRGFFCVLSVDKKSETAAYIIVSAVSLYVYAKTTSSGVLDYPTAFRGITS